MRSFSLSPFRNNNPDKGTETPMASNLFFIVFSFRNNNPDKGTETHNKNPPKHNNNNV